jgi:putative peptide zinc metalloprotease protein
MSDTQSTFHESWHRVADLKPRLRAGIHISRQYFRGCLWHVIQDQANNAFARLNTPGYSFVGLLDGSRSVRQAWDICNTKLGDDAPTQGEVIELLGQLASNNLLESGTSPDAQAMFERFKRRRNRDLQGRLMNLLFPRMPLFDPDAILERGIFLVGWIFAWPGLIVWAMLIGTAVYTLLNAGPVAGKLLSDSSGLLRPDNWLLLLLAFIVDKTVHESGHAIACKKFGKRFGTGGEVHVIGIMLLIFTPVPYVDASSAWLLPDKWRRAIVGAAGMWMEFALAAVAAIVWRYSNGGSTLHAFCYNLMFIASVATVFFNGNPFLRYDGYYILADLLEIPNLLGRAMQYATYLARHYLFGVKRAINPSETPGQRRWLLVYLALSGVVRILVCTGIILFLVANLRQYPQLTLLLLTMAAIAAATWLLVPLGRGTWYLLSNPELVHLRGRAIGVSLAIAAVVVTALGIVPLPHHSRVEGVVRTENQRGVYAQSGGFLTWYAPSYNLDQTVRAGTALVRLTNPILQASLAQAQCRLAAVRIKRRKALASNPALAEILSRQIHALNQEILRLNKRIGNLTISAPVGGVWTNSALRLQLGGYIPRGGKVGTIAVIAAPRVYAAASQGDAGRILRSGSKRVEMRLPGQPGHVIMASLARAYPGGGNQLPSAALSYLADGPFAPSLHAKAPNQSAEPFFMLVFRPTGKVRLLPGQRIVARVRLPDQSLLTDIVHDLRRTLQPGTGL